MNIRHFHDWKVDYAGAARIQKDLAGRVILRDRGLPDRISLVAGADVSYSRGDNVMYAAVVVLDFASMETVEESCRAVTVDFPYIPGLLSFREGPALLAAFGDLRTEPEVVLFDGQGIAHPRGLGLASHMGLLLDLPSIGCAKSRLCGEYDDVGCDRGDSSPLEHRGKRVGAVLRTKNRVKPLYISPGHNISLESALEIVLSCCRGYRLPEPTRQAHLAVNRLRVMLRQSPR
ncbi:MAG: deoxyribonuclease V [Syntrophales bacterium]|jgi:deoxyribonuclease V|nr:deoxyribonuclease V [Syntrophales bacterium]MCK9527473.1 deoxyribonuclease V [Syntrophales bacterium]MDX9922529.1 deoxyribonuclease V [Syntrophales bacterium]